MSLAYSYLDFISRVQDYPFNILVQDTNLMYNLQFCEASEWSTNFLKNKIYFILIKLYLLFLCATVNLLYAYLLCIWHDDWNELWMILLYPLETQSISVMIYIEILSMLKTFFEVSSHFLFVPCLFTCILFLFKFIWRGEVFLLILLIQQHSALHRSF